MFEKLKSALSHARGREYTSARTNLAKSLQRYAPYSAPHVGFGKQLSDLQANENLVFFESVLPRRLDFLASFLRDHAGIEIEPALKLPREHSLELTESLNKWAGKEWPALYDPRFRLDEGWVNSRREGNDIALSLMVDISMLLGELVRRVNSDWSWGVDFDKGNLKDSMLSSRRVVLIAAPVGSMPYPFVEDVESLVLSRLQQIDQDNGRSLAMNPWRRMVDEGQSGAVMAFYRNEAKD